MGNKITQNYHTVKEDIEFTKTLCLNKKLWLFFLGGLQG
jgi:hypothetical protein